MSGYTRNIAVIKGIKDGFSADGGQLSGLVKTEKYGLRLTVEVSYINFAPLSEGRYVTALTDGKSTVIVENGRFDGDSEVDTSKGFASLVCFIKDGVFPVASAICGDYRGEALILKSEVERMENIVKEKSDGDTGATRPEYEDEAIADENYYEYPPDEDGGAVRKAEEEKEDGAKPRKNEENIEPVEKSENAGYSGGNINSPLAGGDFYARMRAEIEGILSAYPSEKALEDIIEGSKWVRISYGDGKFYVFGVIYSGGNAEYICYGIPANDANKPPESMGGDCSFIPAEVEGFTGFWVMYQDASTGATLKILNS